MGFALHIKLIAVLTIACGAVIAPAACVWAQEEPPQQEKNLSQIPSVLEADQFIYDQKAGTVTANGNVVLVEGARTLRADTMTYNLSNDLAHAEGHAVFTDEDGNTHYADRLELSNSMRQGFVDNLYSVLDDDSRMWAVKAVRESPTRHVLKDARYTPCKACADKPDEAPVWALRASKVTHDKKEAVIKYDDVRFEAKGIPVMYVPYFSHPDGSINQKSGFLSPQMGFGSDYGFNATSRYYWAISPSMDATAGLRFFTKTAPQLNLETRKRYDSASVRVAGSMTNSDRVDRVNGIDTQVDDQFRGHFEMQSLWDVNRNWRAGTDLFVTSDEQYLEQYDVVEDADVLTNRIYTERFDDRDYASIELLAFQDLRLDQDVDQPNALPLANMSFVGAPNSAAGGRFKWDTNFLTLFRDGKEQDMNRVVSSLAWQRRDILPAGLTSRLDLSMRGDTYYTSDRTIAVTDPTEDASKFDSRVIPTANLEIAYPLQKKVTQAQIRVKPKVGLTARPNIDNDSDIPNEDSIDAQIDVTNLFETDRFPGYDRVEDRSRVNYGIETGYYTDDGDQMTMQVGQSYRFDNKDNPFPNGSGFEDQKSDFVGQIGAGLDDYMHNINYRFQLDGQKLNAERHEIFGSTGTEKTRFSAVYLYERGSPGTEFTESRQQFKGAVTQQLNDRWGITGSGLFDLGEEPGLRKSKISLSYDDDCFGVTSEVQRELQRDATGVNDTTVMLRFRLKNLGEFETTAYDYGSDSDSTGDDLSGISQ